VLLQPVWVRTGAADAFDGTVDAAHSFSDSQTFSCRPAGI
jgi:hypothetical protein